MRTETKSPSNSIASNVTNSMQNKVLNTSSFKNGIVSLISKSRIWVGERFVGQVMLHKRIKALTVLVAFVESWYTACEAHQLESPPWGCEVPGRSLHPFTERRRRSLIRARIASTPQTIVLRFWLHFSLSLFTYTLSHLRTPRAGEDGSAEPQLCRYVSSHRLCFCFLPSTSHFTDLWRALRKSIQPPTTSSGHL